MKKYAEVLNMIKQADWMSAARERAARAKRLIGRKDNLAEAQLKKAPTPLNKIKDTVNWDPNAIQPENTQIPLPKSMQDASNVGRFTGSHPVAPADHIDAYNYMKGFGETPSAFRSRLDSKSKKLYGTNYATQRRKNDLQSAWKDYERRRNNLLSRERQQLPGGGWIGQLDPESLREMDLINHDKYLSRVDQINKQHDFLNNTNPTREQQLEYWRIQGAKNKAQMQQLNGKTPAWENEFQDNNKKQLAKATMRNRPGSATTFMSDEDPNFATWAAGEAKRQDIQMPAVDAGGRAANLNPEVRQNIFNQGYTPAGAEEAKNFQQIPEDQVKPVEDPAQSTQQPQVPPQQSSYNPAQRLQYDQQTGVWNRNTNAVPQQAQQQKQQVPDIQSVDPKAAAMQERADSQPEPSAATHTSVTTSQPPQQPVNNAQNQQQPAPVQPKSLAAPQQGIPQPQNTQNQQQTVPAPNMQRQQVYTRKPGNRINGRPAQEMIRNTQKQVSSDPNYALPDKVAVPTASGGKIWVSRNDYINRPQGTQGIARARQEQMAYAQNQQNTQQNVPGVRNSNRGPDIISVPDGKGGRTYGKLWQSPNRRQFASNPRTYYRYRRGRAV